MIYQYKLILINQLILIYKNKITVNMNQETIYLPQVAASYQDAICNFTKIIS